MIISIYGNSKDQAAREILKVAKLTIEEGRVRLLWAWLSNKRRRQSHLFPRGYETIIQSERRQLDQIFDVLQAACLLSLHSTEAIPPEASAQMSQPYRKPPATTAQQFL